MIQIKMYRPILLLWAILTTSSIAIKAQNPFSIQGQLAKDKQGIVVLHYYKHNVFVRDTAKVVNGKFEFKGDIGDPSYADICLNPPASKTLGVEYDSQPFYIDGTVKINSTTGIADAKITGNKSQIDYLAMDKIYPPFELQKAELTKQGKAFKAAMNDTAVASTIKKMNELSLNLKQAEADYIKARPDSHVAFRLWSRKHRGVIEPKLELEFKHFSAAIRNGEAGKKMGLKIEMAKKLSAGNYAPDFTLKDTLGKDVSLSSFKGKNVLLCFWYQDFLSFKSFTFNMRRVAKRMQDKNLVILGVYYNALLSNSPSEDRWKSAIRENGMTWTNVYDRRGMDNLGAVSATAKAYGNESSLEVPILYLIGPDGKILARNLNYNDAELSVKIENLMK